MKVERKGLQTLPSSLLLTLYDDDHHQHIHIIIIIIIIIIIVVIIIIIITISFMQGIHTYIPETNYVPREYSAAAILLLLSMVFISLVSVLNLLYFYISTSEVRAQCPTWLFSVVP
jgi:hypothetical protein